MDINIISQIIQLLKISYDIYCQAIPSQHNDLTKDWICDITVTSKPGQLLRVLWDPTYHVSLPNRQGSSIVRRFRTWRLEDDLLLARMKVFRTSCYAPASVERNSPIRTLHRCNVFSTSTTNKYVRKIFIRAQSRSSAQRPWTSGRVGYAS